MPYPGPLLVLHDSGPPVTTEGTPSTDYTTLVLVHGFAWHSGIFSKLPPLGPQHNARVVLVNRRDYLGAAPHTPKELAILQGTAAEPDVPVAQATLLEWMKERARELYDLLVWLVETEHIPPAGTPEGNPSTGGIVLVGWSFGTILVTALLANLASFSKETSVALSSFVQRVVFHDAPYMALGFPPVLNPYNPLADPTIAPEEATRAFAVWVSGYYDHGDLQSMDSLERRTHLESPPPTVSTLSEEERANSFCPGPGSPGGSDSLLLVGGVRSRLFNVLRERALRLDGTGEQTDEGEEGKTTDVWAGVEVRCVWCDRSVWEMPWCAWNLRAELEGLQRSGKRIRKVTFEPIQGANHFVHWDEPERAMQAFLSIPSTSWK
ncbi:hypothetical protein C8Q76DRAFT_798424 [Earliella scabrosa]|nr:hypothetical protein C8Q76DRAFT_798424 [Earliella scabrosa]